jgi:hypothetical protein
MALAWPYLRAALITLVLASQCVSAVPARPLTASMLQRAEGRRAVRQLERVEAWFGAAEAPARIERDLIALSEACVQARRALLAPFAFILSGAAISQAWGLFLNAYEEAYRLRVEARVANGAWSLIYRVGREDLLGLSSVLDYRRIRATYNPKAASPRGQYAGFARWLSRRVLRAHPEFDALRVSMERMQLATRESENQLLDITYVVEHTRAELP